MISTGLELLGKRGTVGTLSGKGRIEGTVIAALNSEHAVVFDEGANETTRQVYEEYLEDAEDFLFLPDGENRYPIFCWVGDGDFELAE